MATETKEEWCERTFMHVDAELGAVERWALSGRSSMMGRFANFGVVHRKSVPTAEALYASIEREISGNSDLIDVRVRAYAHGATGQISQRRWEVYRREEDEVDAGPSSDISVQLVSQSIRHSEHYHEVATAGMRETIKFLSHELDEARAEIKELRQVWREQYRLVQELEDKKLERAIRAEGKETMNQGVRAGIHIAQYLATGGKLGGGQDGSLVPQAVQEFFGSFTQAQLAQLQTVLRPEQMLTAAQLLGGGPALGEASPPDTDTQGEAVEVDEEDEDEADVTAERARSLRLLKMSLAEAEYAEVLSLLQVDRALLDEPERLVVLAKAAAKKHQASGANADASTPAADTPDAGEEPDDEGSASTTEVPDADA